MMDLFADDVRCHEPTEPEIFHPYFASPDASETFLSWQLGPPIHCCNVLQ